MHKANKNVKLRRRRALTLRQKRELAALAALPDYQTDTSDIPELPPGAWKNAIRGRFYRPVKHAISLRLDADVISWLKKPGKGYQTRANSILREDAGRVAASVISDREQRQPRLVPKDRARTTHTMPPFLER